MINHAVGACPAVGVGVVGVAAGVAAAVAAVGVVGSVPTGAACSAVA